VGKIAFAELLNESLKFMSSSQGLDIFIYDTLKEEHGYTSSVECFEDRVNYRPK
jgi:hypothetical protein